MNRVPKARRFSSPTRLRIWVRRFFSPSETWPGMAGPSPPHEKEQLRAALEHHNWNITAVARELQVHRSTVYRKIQQFGIRAEHP
jgi:transcriptional regulator of acetoin/glycerol metabolism